MDYLRYYLNILIMAVGILGFVLGGQWVWLGFSTFVALAIAEFFTGMDTTNRHINHPRIADLPIYLHLPMIIGLWVAFGWRLNIGFWDETETTGLTWLAIAGSLASVIWLSIVPNLPVAHEFLHRNSRHQLLIGRIMCAFFFDASRNFCHNAVHHAFYDTPKDSDTGRRGDTVYGFLPRCTWDAYYHTYKMEKARLEPEGYSVFGWHSHFMWGWAMNLSIPLAMYIFAGPQVAAWSLVALISAKILLETFNFIQHFGLVRPGPAPAATHHTWSHLSPIARVIGLEITNHVDHHRNPRTPYYELTTHPEGPQLDNFFLDALRAFIPPWWNAYMKKRLKHWDLEIATPQERELAAAENRRAGWPDWSKEARETAKKAA